MHIPQVRYTEADKAFVNIYNAQAVALAAGDSVVWYTTSPDGVRTYQPTTATLSLFVGVADSPIPTLSYGEAQAYGYRSAALVTNTTDQIITAGDILVPMDQKDYLGRSGQSDGKYGFVFAGETVATAATPAAALKKVFIRAL